MGDLRLKAKEILKLKQHENDIEAEERELSLEEMVNYQKSKSKNEFIEKIQKEIDEFDFNLLDAANHGETLKIDILDVEKDLFSRKEPSIKALIKYLPIKQKIVNFLSETNFEFVAEEIIIDETLFKLYNLICENGIYPEWKIRESKTATNTIVLYLEVNPLIGFDEQKSELKRKLEQRKKIEKHAVVLYTKSLEEMKKERKRDRKKEFLLIFFSSLYISVVILTILSSAMGLFPVEKITETFGLVAIAWPYYIFTDIQGIFLLAFPIGLIFSLYLAYKKS